MFSWCLMFENIGGFFGQVGDFFATAGKKAVGAVDDVLEVVGNLPENVRIFADRIEQGIDEIEHEYSDTLGRAGSVATEATVQHYYEQYKPLIWVAVIGGGYWLYQKYG